MFIPKELDAKNTYNPNLKNIKESAERTLGEADVFFEMIETYLQTIKTNVSKLSNKKIYDICSAVASELAKCSEMYLKAIYIYENNIDDMTVDEIWNNLKKQTFKTDDNGNLIYLLEKKER